MSKMRANSFWLLLSATPKIHLTVTSATRMKQYILKGLGVGMKKKTGWENTSKKLSNSYFSNFHYLFLDFKDKRHAQVLSTGVKFKGKFYIQQERFLNLIILVNTHMWSTVQRTHQLSSILSKSAHSKYHDRGTSVLGVEWFCFFNEHLSSPSNKFCTRMTSEPDAHYEEDRGSPTPFLPAPLYQCPTGCLDNVDN